jgi:hypothetical protein
LKREVALPQVLEANPLFQQIHQLKLTADQLLFILFVVY